MLLIPDPARGADGQGGLVDLACGSCAVRSLGVTGSTDVLNGLLLDLVPVPMTDAGVQFAGLVHCVEFLGLALTGLPVRRASLGRCLDGLRRYLDSLRLGVVSFFLLVELLEHSPVEAEQDVGVMLARLGPEIPQVGPQHLDGD